MMSKKSGSCGSGCGKSLCAECAAGAPGDPPIHCALRQGSKYTQVFADYTVKSSDGVIDVRAPGVTLTLPENPKPGFQVRIIASSGDVVVNGNGHPIASGGSLLPDGSSHLLTFSCTPNADDPEAGGQWIVTAGAGASDVSQATWYINAVTGDNADNGKTPTTALKTYAEFQKRIGLFTTLTPTGGVLRVNIMSDLPVTDPITFRNFIAAGSTVFITGREKIVRSVSGGTITYGARDRSVPVTGGTPFTVTASPLPGPPATAWDPYIRLMIKTSGGAKAYILRNLLAKTAHVGSWMQDIPDTATPFSVPYSVEVSPGVFRDRPVNNTSFQILDFSRVTLGEGLVGYDFTQSLFTPDYGPPGGVTLENLHSDGDTGQGDWTMWRSIGSNETLIHTRNVIHDRLVEVPAGNKQNVWSHTLFTIGSLIMGGCEVQMEGCSFRPYAGFAGYPGGMRALPGSSIVHDGDQSFVGDVTDPFAPQAADIQMFGLISGGPISFWDSNHAYVLFNTGLAEHIGQTPFYVDFGYVPLWGNGNQSLMAFQPGAKLLLEQINVSAPNPLPTLTFNGTGGGFPSVMGTQAIIDNQANRWDRPAVVYRHLIDTTWANLEIDVAPAGGGFRDPGSNVFIFPEGTLTGRFAAMIRPEVDAHLNRIDGVFVPAP